MLVNILILILLKICFNDLLAPGGTIAIDNALYHGKPYLPDTPPNDGVTKFNDMIVSRDDIYHVSRVYIQ